MKSYRDELLAFVKAYTDAREGQMTLSDLGPTTYPDPAKTSYNESVSWRVELTFGRGYFTGAVVRFTGRWNSPHPEPGKHDDYHYSEGSREFPVEEAVDAFLSAAIPEWAIPTSGASAGGGPRPGESQSDWSNRCDHSDQGSAFGG